jgi:hypothetical protein
MSIAQIRPDYSTVAPSRDYEQCVTSQYGICEGACVTENIRCAHLAALHRKPIK